jgi:Ca2+-binding EF-hand superfamily protein
MKSLLLASACALLMCSNLAMAQQAMHQGHKDQLDTDDNGSVSKQEYQAFMAGAFNKLDTDGDGNLRSADVGKILTADQFSSMDRDGNGVVSRTEFMNQVMTDFASADKGGDGHLQ